MGWVLTAWSHEWPCEGGRRSAAGQEGWSRLSLPPTHHELETGRAAGICRAGGGSDALAHLPRTSRYEGGWRGVCGARVLI